ncbi:uracil-DNA glycosylase family protein [Aquisediminimonas sediminicola]|uniref:uracil-DNA glycosylase family protein n=1 Tax=Alteraquisediminimonas sediminicola TaxID=2676787 RepID=UPI001C8EC740|nr:uracil-DNA glycosylase family protein [Aquisediminimonas sediminicola]
MNSTSQPMIGQMLDWWALAGLDSLVSDDAHSWLAAPKPDPVQIRHAGGEENGAPAPTTHVIQMVEPSLPLPDILSAFAEWIKDPSATPMLDPGLARFAPRGSATPRLLILVDRPEEGDRPEESIRPDDSDSPAGQLLHGPAGRLLSAMLAAIGVAESEVMVASLLPVYHAGGRIEAAWLPRLAAIATRLAQLAAPQAVLLLGDATSRALIGSGAIDARQHMQEINHDAGKVGAIVTLHPRFLLQKPAAKALAWQDLQLLRRLFAQ